MAEKTKTAKVKSTNLSATLREEVERLSGPEDGTVVKFDYVYDLTLKKKEQTVYRYVGVYLAARGLWYISGNGSAIAREQNHAAFMTLLAQANVTSAEVATGFDTFKP